MRTRRFVFLCRWVATLGLATALAAGFSQTPPPAAPSPAVQAGSDLLGPEDVIDVTVVDQPKFSGEYLVPDSGIIDMPVVGEVNVLGMTVEQLRILALKRLKMRLIHPEVAIVVRTPRPHRVYVYGDIQKPGILDLRPGWHIQEAFTAVGGLIPGIEMSDVKVTLDRTDTKEHFTSPLRDALNPTGDIGKQILEPGDVVSVESMANLPVYVTGKVKVPGFYRLRSDDAGLLQAITQAGGTTDDANITLVKIQHADRTEQTVDLSPVLLHGKEVNLPKLGAGDTVVVPETLDRVVVLGYVKSPGYYPIPSGQTFNLSDALGLAGGIDKTGRVGRVGFITHKDGKEYRTVIDFTRYLKRGDLKSNPPITPGDIVYVPQTDHIDITSVLSSIGSVGLFWGQAVR